MSDWTTPSETPPLLPGEAHVWRIATGVSVGELDAMLARLPASERERAGRIGHPETRRAFIVARAALRSLLGRYLGTPAEQELRFSPYGKPHLAGAHEGRLEFSVAHSGDLVMLAFARADVGVDVEHIRPVPRAGRIIARVFPGATRAVLASVPPAEQLAAFFAAWTQREALVKAVGGGMLVTVDPLDFLWPVPPTARRLETVSGGARRTWTIAHLAAPEPFAAALVVADAVVRIRLFARPPG